MVKIKQKKQLNLPQLIEWAWENGVENKAFYSNCDGGSVYFDGDGDVYVEHEIAKTETFTVEVEEEIDEDTVFEVMVKINKNGSIEPVCNHKIFNMEDSDSKEFHAYIDGEFKLIWRNGKLVE